MFYQILFFPQVKRWASITYKHNIYVASQISKDSRILGN